MGYELTPRPRSLQEWMERTGTNGLTLLALMRERGDSVSPTLLSFILRGSRQCSLVRARLLSEITGVPVRSIRSIWKRQTVSGQKKPSGDQSNAAA